MPRVFVSNFDFEHELAGLPDLSRAARSVTTHLSGVWRTIAEPGDVVLEQGPDGTTSPEAYTLVPWGWSESMLALAARHGVQARHPPLDVVRRVNERSFRFRLEQELNIALPGACELRSLGEAAHAVDRLNGPWVLKAAFGMAGREQLRGSGVLSSQARSWVADKLTLGPIVVEPWLDSLGEAGLQFEVPESGPPQLVGVTPQIVDRRGTYRGSLFGAAEDNACWESAVEVGLEVARRVQTEGYFGPLSLDAMRYRDGDVEGLRPLQDLNARWSMGRLALGLVRQLSPGECGAWVHLPRGVSEDALKAIGRLDVRLKVVTVDAHSLRQTILLAAPDGHSRRAAIEMLKVAAGAPHVT